MTDLQPRYERLAAVVEYPTEQTVVALETCLAELASRCPEATESASAFRDYLRDNPLEAVQETYVRTFDFSAAATLNVSHHLFGEDHRRGMFLAQLKDSLDAAGIECAGELPDHLSIVLRWLARLVDRETYTEMLQECVLPALAKAETALAESTNPYRDLLRALRLVLQQDLRCA